MTTNQDALLKIRHQIQVAELYRVNNPDWVSPVAILAQLRERERILANRVQVELFRAELDQMDHLYMNMQHGE